MNKVDLAFAEGSFIEDILRFFKRRKFVRRQRTFCWCPICKQDLCSSNSFVSDTDLVRYECSNCGAISEWNFDAAPAPLLFRYQHLEDFLKANKR